MPCQHWQGVQKPTPQGRVAQPWQPVHHVPPRARAVPVPWRSGHRPPSSHAEEGSEAPGRWEPSAAGDGPGLSTEEGPVPGGFWKSCAGNGCSSRRDPGRPPHSGDYQCAAGDPGEPAASRNAVRTASGQFWEAGRRGISCQIFPLWDVAVNTLSPSELPLLCCLSHPPHYSHLQPPSHPSDTSDAAHLLCWVCCLSGCGEETLSKGHVPVLVTHCMPLAHQAPAGDSLAACVGAQIHGVIASLTSPGRCC